MRSQKVAADAVKTFNPVNKLRRDAPQVQAPVKPKGAGKQFQTDAGKTALKSLFMKQRRGG